jgi:hypothetical protein
MAPTIQLPVEAPILEVQEDRTLPVRLLPWLENQYGLVSLLDLMRDAAIAEVISTLRALWISATFVGAPGLEDNYRNAHSISVKERLNKLDALCIDLKLPMTRLHVKDALDAVERARTLATPSRWEVADRACMILTNNLEKEMSLRKYFTLPPEKAEVFDRDFGAEIATAFPSTLFDIAEASKCFALSRSTACVFHLMRVLEIGLSVFATRFNIPSNHTNWHNIIEGIERAVRDMPNDPQRPPDWKDQQEFFSQAASYFMVVKDAWRNYTAHKRGKYTEEEAETMLINVRGFMQKLATRLHE